MLSALDIQGNWSSHIILLRQDQINGIGIVMQLNKVLI